RRVVEACRLIELAEREPTLKELAEAAGLSSYHFQRVFKRIVGVTPKQYAIAHRSRIAAENLKTCKDVTSAIYASGYGASSRFYESAQPRHGMSVTELRRGGDGVEIRYAFGDSSLGLVAVAATERGICAVLFGASPHELVEELRKRFPKADFELADADSDFAQWVERTVAYLDGESAEFGLPLDVRGTAFQERVWRTLREIPEGQTASYAEVAKRIGRPRSIRAVAGACAANPVAVVIPCHRVIRADGGLSGYRWGTDRKRTLLKREAAK
ncbi:MAG: methylated-DNA--[protein]-cysteine S-methyltransferase, partial [Polyangiales bacterium]